MVFPLIFLAFNALMIAWLISYWNAVGGHVGAVITGLFALLTRGKKIYIEETVE